MRMRRGGRASAVAILLLCSGCTVRSIVRDSIDEGSKDANWEKIKKPARALTAEIISGSVDALSGPERQQAISRLTEELVAQFMKTASTQLDTNLGPAATRQVRLVVAGAMDELLAQNVRANADQLVERVTKTAVDTLGSSAASSIDDHVGPALARLISKEVGPALGTALRDNVRVLATSLQDDLQPKLAAALEQSAAATARGFVSGSREKLDPWLNDALARLDKSVDKGKTRRFSWSPARFATWRRASRPSSSSPIGSNTRAPRTATPAWRLPPSCVATPISKCSAPQGARPHPI